MNGSLQVIDSHTGGEPTRIVIGGGPDLGFGSVAERAARFRTEFDHVRNALCNEPRGHEAMVGGLLVEPEDPSCVCGIIFFNNASTLQMCIHGTMGLAETLRHLGRITVGEHRIETPVGIVTARLEEGGQVSVQNVPSWLHQRDVVVRVDGWGEVCGDIAWGGNWFFLIDGERSLSPRVTRGNLVELASFARAVKVALQEQGVTGAADAEVDHVEIFGVPMDPRLADSRNFVMCPGNAYDRSACGTGTSAKLACLHARGELAAGMVWRQAGILDTVFEGSYESLGDGRILPRIRGRAWITGQSELHFAEDDPFRHGIDFFEITPQPGSSK